MIKIINNFVLNSIHVAGSRLSNTGFIRFLSNSRVGRFAVGVNKTNKAMNVDKIYNFLERNMQIGIYTGIGFIKPSKKLLKINSLTNHITFDDNEAVLLLSFPSELSTSPFCLQLSELLNNLDKGKYYILMYFNCNNVGVLSDDQIEIYNYVANGPIFTQVNNEKSGYTRFMEMNIN